MLHNKNCEQFFFFFSFLNSVYDLPVVPFRFIIKEGCFLIQELKFYNNFGGDVCGLVSITAFSWSFSNPLLSGEKKKKIIFQAVTSRMHFLYFNVYLIVLSLKLCFNNGVSGFLWPNLDLYVANLRIELNLLMIYLSFVTQICANNVFIYSSTMHIKFHISYHND